MVVGPIPELAGSELVDFEGLKRLLLQQNLLGTMGGPPPYKLAPTNGDKFGLCMAGHL